MKKIDITITQDESQKTFILLNYNPSFDSNTLIHNIKPTIINSKSFYNEQKSVIYPSMGKNLYEVTLTDLKEDRSDRFRIRFSLEDIPNEEKEKCAGYAPKKFRKRKCGYVLYKVDIRR